MLEPDGTRTIAGRTFPYFNERIALAQIGVSSKSLSPEELKRVVRERLAGLEGCDVSINVEVVNSPRFSPEDQAAIDEIHRQINASL